ncbi:MAG: histidinol-phosphatase HisJ family protein [Verrucomicrobiales bacterium]
MSSSAPVLFDSHMHTPLCKHAVGHPRSYARTGFERGLKGVTFTCHSPMPERWSHAVRMEPEKLGYYIRLIEQTAAELEGEFAVRLGLESDWFPGMEPWLEQLHRRARFHYILGSVHYHVAEYQEMFFHGDIRAFQEGYFGHLADSAESGLFDALSHPDLVKNAAPDSWDFAAIRSAIESALDRIAATGVALELNTSGLNKSVAEMNPGIEMLRMIRSREIPVVLGSDAHVPQRVGADFEFALEQLAEAGFTTVSQFENREREDLAISHALASLRDTTMSSAEASLQP